jgi:hypothetical protein
MAWHVQAVAPNSTSFLNDLVLDRATNMAFISDASGVVDGVARGGLVSLNLTSGESRRFVDASTGYDPNFYFTINPPAGFVNAQVGGGWVGGCGGGWVRVGG